MRGAEGEGMWQSPAEDSIARGVAGTWEMGAGPLACDARLCWLSLLLNLPSLPRRHKPCMPLAVRGRSRRALAKRLRPAAAQP